MKFIYPAVFRKISETKYEGFFPDLEDCVVSGETLDEAVDAANEAANNWLSCELMEDQPMLPPVSDIADLDVSHGEIVRNICVTIRFYEGWDE